MTNGQTYYVTPECDRAVLAMQATNTILGNPNLLNGSGSFVTSRKANGNSNPGFGTAVQSWFRWRNYFLRLWRFPGNYRCPGAEATRSTKSKVTSIWYLKFALMQFYAFGK